MGTQAQTHPSDRIQKTVTLRAPRGRVWRAISNPKDFGAWFGASLAGSFVPGTTVSGKITPTTVDPTVAAEQEPYVGMPIELMIDRVEPDRLLQFRWHPYPNAPEEGSPTTSVSFQLEDDPEGVVLTITESGFDRLPAERRTETYVENERGWEKQTELIQKYVSAS
jgi:uncharacterized protein YndB with AHSA1/START domain